MCVDSEWRALCQDGWSSNDAGALCGILGFSQCKLILAIYIYTWTCMHTITALRCNSCFGRSNQTRGIRHIECSGQPRTCTWNDDIGACGKDAGLVCSEFGYGTRGIKIMP